MANNPNAQANLKSFAKGDPRINRKGRPKTFGALRAFVLEVGNEVISSKDGATQTTRIQAIVRDWYLSNNFQKQKAILEIAFGKVPDQVELTGKDGGELVIRYVNDWRNPEDADA